MSRKLLQYYCTRLYAGNFTRAEWVLFDDLGHNDIWTITGPGMQHLIQRFIDEGIVDTSAMGKIPRWEFTPTVTFHQMFQQMMMQQKGTSP